MPPLRASSFSSTTQRLLTTQRRDQQAGAETSEALGKTPNIPPPPPAAQASTAIASRHAHSTNTINRTFLHSQGTTWCTSRTSPGVHGRARAGCLCIGARPSSSSLPGPLEMPSLTRCPPPRAGAGGLRRRPNGCVECVSLQKGQVATIRAHCLFTSSGLFMSSWIACAMTISSGSSNPARAAAIATPAASWLTGL